MRLARYRRNHLYKYLRRAACLEEKKRSQYTTKLQGERGAGGRAMTALGSFKIYVNYWVFFFSFKTYLLVLLKWFWNWLFFNCFLISLNRWKVFLRSVCAFEPSESYFCLSALLDLSTCQIIISWNCFFDPHETCIDYDVVIINFALDYAVTRHEIGHVAVVSFCILL